MDSRNSNVGDTRQRDSSSCGPIRQGSVRVGLAVFRRFVYTAGFSQLWEITVQAHVEGESSVRSGRAEVGTARGMQMHAPRARIVSPGSLCVAT